VQEHQIYRITSYWSGLALIPLAADAGAGGREEGGRELGDFLGALEAS
jgi:hypothetical protein